MKNIIIASDHAGLALKQYIIDYIEKKLLEFKSHDLGAYSTDSVDYPDYAKLVALKMLEENNNIGILICGSGIGISIAANRFSHIRAALCFNEEMADLARRHNNANILVLGARLIEKEKSLKILEMFLQSKFEYKRHLNRVNKLSKLTD